MGDPKFRAAEDLIRLGGCPTAAEQIQFLVELRAEVRKDERTTLLTRISEALKPSTHPTFPASDAEILEYARDLVADLRGGSDA